MQSGVGDVGNRRNVVETVGLKLSLSTLSHGQAAAVIGGFPQIGVKATLQSVLTRFARKKVDPVTTTTKKKKTSTKMKQGSAEMKHLKDDYLDCLKKQKQIKNEFNH